MIESSQNMKKNDKESFIGTGQILKDEESSITTDITDALEMDVEMDMDMKKKEDELFGTTGQNLIDDESIMTSLTDALEIDTEMEMDVETDIDPNDRKPGFLVLVVIFLIVFALILTVFLLGVLQGGVLQGEDDYNLFWHLFWGLMLVLVALPLLSFSFGTLELESEMDLETDNDPNDRKCKISCRCFGLYLIEFLKRCLIAFLIWVIFCSGGYFASCLDDWVCSGGRC